MSENIASEETHEDASSIRFDLLRELGRYLISLPSLPNAPMAFNFNSWMAGRPTEGHTCGTAGCAVGFCPIVFPEHWSVASYVENIEADDDLVGIDVVPIRLSRGYPGIVFGSMPVLRERWETQGELARSEGLVRSQPLQDAMDFFGLSENQARHLFTAGYQREIYGGNVLEAYATSVEVGQNIIDFCDKLEGHVG